MPRFFFDIRDQTGTQYDGEGVDFPDLNAARAEARRALAEIIAETIGRDGTGATCIEIRTETGMAVVEVVGATDDRVRR